MSAIRDLARVFIATSLASVAAGCSDDGTSRANGAFDVAAACVERAGIKSGEPDSSLVASIRAGQDGSFRVLGPPDDDWWLFVSLDEDPTRSFRAIQRQLNEPGGIVGTESMISGQRGDFAYYVPRATVKLFERKQVEKILKCVDR